MFDLTVLGDKKLQRKLNKLEKKLGSKVMRSSLKTAMEPVRDLAKRRAPVDTGLMQRSIRIGTKSNRNGVSAMVRTGTRKQLKIPEDDKYYYPAAIEYGSRLQPARSFLRASLGRLKGTVLKITGREIAKHLEYVK